MLRGHLSNPCSCLCIRQLRRNIAARNIARAVLRKLCMVDTCIQPTWLLTSHLHAGQEQGSILLLQQPAK